MPETAHLFLSGRRKLNHPAGYLHYESIDTSQPIGGLQSFDELVLGPGTSLKGTAAENQLLYLLPLVGSVNATIGTTQFKIKPGQSAVLPTIQSTYSISNPELEGEVTVLKALIQTSGPTTPEVSDIDPDGNLDRLLVPHVSPMIRLGQFKGRRHSKLKLHPPGSLFVFVIEGAFEVQGRLLERRDGLALHDFAEVEFESLSDYAMIWMIEL